VIDNITVIIVSYKSKKTIFNCIKSIGHFNKILILDNSNDKELKKKLKNKYSKIKFFLSKKNTGYGAGYNFLLKKVKTPYALLMTPDTSFKKGAMSKFLLSLKKLKNNFTLMGPYKQNKNFALEKKKIINEIRMILGFCMLINIKNINKNNFFDENFFLYLEDIDLCRRLINNNQKIYINKSFIIDHIGAKSSNIGKNEFDKIRNWHWMWSQFYYYKKNYGYFTAVMRSIGKLLKSVFKIFIYQIIFDQQNKNKYIYRSLGLVNSMLGSKSYYRGKFFN